MKKIILAIFAILMFLPFSASGYTVFIGVDDSLELSYLNGLQFDIAGTGFDWSDSSTSARLYFTTETVVVDGVSRPGAANVFWATDQVTNPTTGFSTFDGMGGGNLLSEGILASITAPDPFVLLNFVLSDFSDPNGRYLYPFTVSARLFDGGAEYTVNAVPIPAAAWLLGSGLLGLVAIRRKFRK